MAKLSLIIPYLLISQISFAQGPNSLPLKNDALGDQIERIIKDQGITADSAWKTLSNWNKYPEIKATKKWYLFLYKDSIFGTVPLKIFIPENYQSNISSPAILILHGAVVLSSFKDAYKDTASDEDLFYNFYAKQNFIIIRPFADGDGPHANGTINFDWVINGFNGRKNRNKTNPTFKTLTTIIGQLKHVLNIDDNKIFVFGHSDGSDGAFALQIYTPTAFAGFICYNSMLTNINARDIYLRNTVNRPLYLVHSDLDDLRPIQETRAVVKILDSLNAPVLYKEYIGYKHYDKHLEIDLPYSFAWTKEVVRNPFQKKIVWEMSDLTYNTCDWIKIMRVDTTLVAAKWQMELNTKLYNKRDKVFIDFPKYDLNKSGAVEVNYDNNVFDVKTSRVAEIALLISPVMVNLANPVVVKINGKEAFNKKVTADKLFLLTNFTTDFDRNTLWVASIDLKIN